jgi:hypothetical protein
VTSILLQEQASNLAKDLGCKKPTGSNGWLCKFQRRQNIRCMKLNGTAADADEGAVNDWQNCIRDLCAG